MQALTSSPHLSDEELIALFWGRDKSAIPETNRKYGKALFRIARRILSDPKECEACRDEAYLRAWNAIPPKRPAVFPAYLTRLVRNAALDRYRETASQKRVPADFTESLDELSHVLSDETSLSRDLEARELGRAISDFLATLSERQRALFVARYYYGEPLEKVAAKLSFSRSAAYREIEKIRKDLKNHLTEKELIP